MFGREDGYLREKWREIVGEFRRDWDGEPIEPAKLLDAQEDIGGFTIVFEDTAGRCWELVYTHHGGDFYNPPDDEWELRSCYEERELEKEMVGEKEEEEDDYDMEI